MQRSSFGFSLIELLIVVGVLSIISVLSFSAFVSLREHKTLDTDAARILAELSQARSLTISGKNGDEWGVHFASSSVTLFEGGSYSASGSGNVVSSLDPLLTISAISLRGGGSDVVFQRLTGETVQSGTVTIVLAASSTESKTITVYGTGLADVR